MEKEPLDSLEQWAHQYLIYLQKNLQLGQEALYPDIAAFFRRRFNKIVQVFGRYP